MELEKLLQISKEWENDFRSSLLEGVTEEYSSICEWINDCVYDWIPQWKEENPENAELYEKYENRILHLNGEELNKEYFVLMDLLHA